LIMGNQWNYKRMLAYSSMENMGIILVGFALGGLGTVGALVQIIAHAFAKSSAFYEAGNILIAFNSKSMIAVQGLIKRLKFSGYLFTISCFSITGAPPFGVFVGEFMIISQAMKSGNVTLTILLAFAYMYAFIGLNRQAIQMVFSHRDSDLDGEQMLQSELSAQRENLALVIIPLVNLTISLFIGISMFPVILQAAAGLGF